MPRSVFSESYEHVMTTLVAARTKAGLTQVELAKRLDKPQSFVSKMERGERRLDIVELAIVARALGADPLSLAAEMLNGVAADAAL